MLTETIFTIRNEKDFEQIALKVFQHQYIHCEVYQRFCNLLGVTKTAVKNTKEIPFLPIEFFKKEKILSSAAPPQEIFTSSGTTGSIISKHYVTDLAIYETSFLKGFQHFYGAIAEYTVLALLPSYLERNGSSLVYMTEKLINLSNQADSGFYLDETEKLVTTLGRLMKQQKKVLLIGVSFALLALVENYNIQLQGDVVIMETGGMKGRRKEMIREKLHAHLKKGFGVSKIHSEYGMTELLSQAYSTGDGVFNCPAWMNIAIRDPEDALTYVDTGKTGGVNVIDLANIHSCSFIATQDLGRIYSNGSFEILGRFDHSDIRGCNLMML